MENFLPSLIGVVLGIVLTFGVNFLWRRHEEKRRTKDMLILVRNELVNNKEVFRIQESLLRKDGEAYQKVLAAKDELASVPEETLKNYYDQIQGITISPLITTAWQIFQNSEMIQKMTDKEMVIRLTDCYVWMAGWNEFIAKDYWEIKKRMLIFDAGTPYHFFSAVLNNNEMLNFYESFRFDKEDIWEAFIATDALIDYTIMLLDKHGDYHYDMEEKDNEITAYIASRMPKKTAENEEPEMTELRDGG